LPHWVAWRSVVRNGHQTKPPINPHTGRFASPTNPATWGTFAQAEQRARRDGLRGVGFVLTAADGLVAIDISPAYAAPTAVSDSSFLVAGSLDIESRTQPTSGPMSG